MALSWGNLEVYGLCLNGNTGVSAMYNGELVWPDSPAVQYPYLLIEFDNASFVPTLNMLYTPYRTTCTWSQESASPNVWRIEIHDWFYDTFGLYGLAYLFRPSGDSGTASLTMTCSLVGSGNFDQAINGIYCQTFDRMFYGCTGLAYIDPIHCTSVMNVGGMFSGCTGVEGGSFDQYNWFVANGVNINNHSGTFTDCGRDTVTGAAELAQIPVGWGGTLVPPSTLMTSARTKWFTNYDTWVLSGSTPTWTNIISMYLFTEASVSAYAGVSMNRSRIRAINGLGTASGNELYFYPCIMQHTAGSSGVITWAVVTASYNGMLASTQPNTDMAGTLDYNTYGAFTHEYGTYDSSQPVCFCFLVLNVTVDNWTGLSDKYGVLFNANFKPDGGFRYFY